MEFINYEVKIISDATFADIQDTLAAAKRNNKIQGNRAQSQQRSQLKRNSFATAVFLSNEPSVNANKRSVQTQTQSTALITSNMSCLFCTQRHTLDQCSQLKRKSHREKLDFLKECALVVCTQGT